MALRKILTEGNSALSKVCRPVTSFDERLATLIDDMKETLVEANGVGLAAPQVGVLRRLVVVDLGDEIIELVNPRILETSGEQDGLEGCLSVPGVYHDVVRPSKVIVKAQDANGVEFTLKASGLMARVIQHEYDHLDGVLFVDRLSEEERKKTLRAYEKKNRSKRRK